MKWLIVVVSQASVTAVNDRLSGRRAFSTNGPFKDSPKFRYAECGSTLI